MPAILLSLKQNLREARNCLDFWLITRYLVTKEIVEPQINMWLEYAEAVVSQFPCQ